MEAPNAVAALTSSVSQHGPMGRTAAPTFEDGRVTVCVRERPFLPIEIHATTSDPSASTTRRCLAFADDGETIRIVDPAASCDDAHRLASPSPRGALVQEPLGPSPRDRLGKSMQYASSVSTTNPCSVPGFTFRFDHAYPMSTPQADVYRDMGSPVLEASFRGFNTCIFAYGQTGSGKSYSMMGAEGGAEIDHEPGLIPRLCTELFERIESLQAQPSPHVTPSADSTLKKVEVTVQVSYLEIYREKVRSLLAEATKVLPATPDRYTMRSASRSPPSSPWPGRRANKGLVVKGEPSLRVRQHPMLGVFVEGLEEIPVTSHAQILHWMKVGNAQRRTAATRMNDVSSRSHAVFALHVVQKHTTTLSDGRVQVTERRSKINLVDLAGSERASTTRAEGDILREGAHINLSLSTLGRVIKALAEQSSAAAAPQPGVSPRPQTQRATPHVPYRDSTLTFLLQESLGGSSKTYMLATLSPAAQNYEETLSTLRYADRAKSIVTRAFVNESASDKRIRELEDEVRRLRDQIRQLQASGLGAQRSAALEEALSAMTGGTIVRAPTSPPAPQTESLSDSMASPEARPPPHHCTVETKDWHRDVTSDSNTSTGESRVEAGSNDQPGARAVDDGVSVVVSRASVPSSHEGSLVSSEEVLATAGALAASSSTLSECAASPLTAQVEQLQSALMHAEAVIRHLTAGENDHGTRELCSREPWAAADDPDVSQKAIERQREAEQAGEKSESPKGDYGAGSAVPTPRSPRAEGGRGRGADLLVPRSSRDASLTDPNKEEEKGAARAGSPVFIPKLALSTLRRAPTPPTLASNSSHSPAATVATHHPAAKTGVAPLSTLPLTARGTRPREDVFDAAVGSRTPPPRGHARRTPSFSGLSHASTKGAGGRLRAHAGNTKVQHEATRFVGQHTLFFVGAPGSGKTCTRENLRQPDRWYNFLVKQTLTSVPTWGLERVAVDVDGSDDFRLVLAELSGQPCFTLLTDFIPWKRVTFALCVSLEHQPSLHEVRQAVELLLCHTERRPIALMLVATHMDKCQLPPAALNCLLEELEGQVRNLCVLLQRQPDLRPIIIGRAAVSNVTREVRMPGFAKVDSFPKLLAWLSDYAYHQCRNDPDFPNGLIPERCLHIRHHLTRMRLARTFSLSARDYRHLVATLFPGQYTDLAQHTQLLTSWGIVLHMDKHERWRQSVVLDVQWLHLILTVMASLGRTAPTPEEERVAAMAAAADGSAAPFPSGGTHTLARVQGSILLSSTPMRKLLRSGHATPTGSAGAAPAVREIPFSPLKVLTADTFGLLRHSIPTVPVLDALMEKLILARSDATPRHLRGIVAILETCDVLIRGTRLLYSPTQRRYRLLRGRSQSHADEIAEEEAVWSAAQQREFFFLLPFTFSAAAPAPVVQHFSKLLSGPFYRFTFTVIPPLFFAKLVSRLVNTPHTAEDTDGHPARKVYVGPLDPVMVETESTAVLDMMADPTTRAHPFTGPAKDRTRVMIPSGQLDLWATCAWLAATDDDEKTNSGGRARDEDGTSAPVPASVTAAGRRPSRSRVLLRLVHHSLFLSFHNVYETVHEEPTRPAGRVCDPLFASASDVADSEPDYDEDLDLDTDPSTTSSVAPSLGHTQLRDATFFQGVLDTVRAVAEEYPGTACEESILSTTTAAPASYAQAWLDDEELARTSGSNRGAPRRDGEDRTRAPSPPTYRTMDINLNSQERIQVREETSLLTARVTHRPRATATDVFAQHLGGEHGGEDDAEGDSRMFPFLRAYSRQRSAAPRRRRSSCESAPLAQEEEQASAPPIPLDLVKRVLAAGQRTGGQGSSLPTHPSGATLEEVLVALNEALCLGDAVQHSLVMDALLDVLSRTNIG